MSRGGVSALWALLAFVSVPTLPLVGQSVISTHSGTVHFSEGAVYLGNEPLGSHLGRFPSVPKGAELRTAEGRAELLLTPTVFLRIDAKSAIRMLTNELSNTRIELLAGSAVVDSAGPSPGTSVTLLYRDWSLRILEQGMYRIDADSARLWVLNGKVQVSDGNDQRRLSVEQGMYLRFATVLVPDRSLDQPRDAFSTWVESRQQTIAADNAIAASTQDPASIPDPALVRASNSGNGFTLPSYAQVAVVGVSVGLISYAYFSTSQRRSSALLPSTQYGFARVVSDAPPRSTRSNGIWAVRLLMPLSARVPLRLPVPVRPVSRNRFLGGVRR
jgi:FecR protein